MLKALRNFIIGLLIGAVVFTLVLPYAYFHESPGKFYADLVNGQLRQRQNTIQLARYFDDGGTHLPILNYRTFVDADAEGNPVTPGITLAQFEWQMQTLIDIGCTFITPQDLLDAIARGENLPSRAVMITFDDGYLSNFVYAYPLLKAHGYTAVIFSVTGGISEQPASFHANQINLLDRKTMASAGDVFYYASHTDNLHHLTGKRSALVTADSETAAADIKRSLSVIRQFPSGVDYLFSYPYGNYSDRVEALLKEQGITLAFRAYKGKLTRKSDPLALPRYPVSHSVSMDTFKGYFSEYFK